MAADKFGGVEKEKRKEGENVHLKTHALQGAWVKMYLVLDGCKVNLLALNQSEAKAKAKFTFSYKVWASWLYICKVVSSAKRMVNRSLKPLGASLMKIKKL